MCSLQIWLFNIIRGNHYHNKLQSIVKRNLKNVTYSPISEHCYSDISCCLQGQLQWKAPTHLFAVFPFTFLPCHFLFQGEDNFSLIITITNGNLQYLQHHQISKSHECNRLSIMDLLKWTIIPVNTPPRPIFAFAVLLNSFSSVDFQLQ